MVVEFSDELYDSDYDDFGDEDDEFEFDCGMTQSGQCTMAGSEDCDFECPYRDTIYRKFFGEEWRHL